MGYLDNSSVTVDAILTNKGRQLLAAGGQLNITKFALADDEIDYDLYNPAHTLGTNYYGAVIENMPLLEALPDETQLMRSKLVTLGRNIATMPTISVNPTIINLVDISTAVTLTPSLVMPAGEASTTQTYTIILSNSNIATVTGVGAGAGSGVGFVDDTTSIGGTQTVTGTTFTIVGKSRVTIDTPHPPALITILGNSYGGFLTIPVTSTVIGTEVILQCCGFGITFNVFLAP